jgi:PAS domain S-box-containing protein
MDAMAFVSRLPSPALLVSDRGKITAASPAMARSLACDLARLVGTRLASWALDPDELDAFLQVDEPSPRALRFCAADGGERWLEVSIAKGALPGAAIICAVDITERRATEQRLQEERDRYLDMISASSDGFWESDGAAHARVRIVQAHRSQGRVTLRSLESRWPDDIVDTCYDPEGFAAWQKQHDAHEPYRNVIFRQLRKDRKEQYFRSSAVPYYKGGIFQGYRGSSVDVTAQVLAEHALRRSQEHLERAQRLAAIGSAERDITAGTEVWSAELYRILGVDRASFEASDDNILALVHPDDRHKVKTGLARARAGVPTPSAEYRIVRPDGEIRTIYANADIEFDRAGRPVRFLSVFKHVIALRDAEARQRESELRLRRSEEHLKHAQRLANTGSVERDFATGSVIWSDELYRILGVGRDFPATFESFLSLVHKDDRAALVARMRAIPNLKPGERVEPDEYRIVRPDGEVRVLQPAWEAIFDDRGEATHLMAALQDVTALRAAEARHRDTELQLHHAQKLEALGALAGGVAHELNNTLVPILALTKLTAKRLPAESRERSNLNTVLQASERARDLVQKILAFSRKEAPKRGAVDLVEVAQRAVDMLRTSLPSTIHFEGALEPVPPILGDADQLHQVIVNLVSNAAHAIGDRRGTITIDVAPAAAAQIPEPHRPVVRLSVRDTGPGMDETIRARIFEPFFTTKPVGEGTGLGLSVAHGIIAGHGGHINLESGVGRGTRFDVYLPTMDATVDACLSPERGSPTLGPTVPL